MLEALWENPGISAEEAANKLGYKKADTGALDAILDKVIAENPKEVELVKGGNAKLINFLTGQVMKASAVKPNPKIVTELLQAKLGV